jgi:hypothetical protein
MRAAGWMPEGEALEAVGGARKGGGIVTWALERYFKTMVLRSCANSKQNKRQCLMEEAGSVLWICWNQS